MRRVIVGLLLVLVAGCSAESGGGATAPPAAPSTPDPQSSESFFDRPYDVDGRTLHLSCQGTGTPTVIYLHGLGGGGQDVNVALASRMPDRVRLCTYDRANVGRSGQQPGRHTGADSVEDLHALLAAAEIDGPYLLLGFSFGGLLAAMYAGTHPENVMGILMLDSSLPTDDEVDALIPKDLRKAVQADAQANGERVDFYRTLEEAEALLDTIPDVPLTYVAAEPVELPPEWPVERMRKRIRAEQKAFVARFPQGRLVTVESSHDVDLEQPELVIAELNRILAR